MPARPRPLTGNERAFTAMVRNALFRRVELFARRCWYDLGLLDADSGWTSERWEEVIRTYFAEHDEVGIGADARGPALLIIDRQPGVWRVRQILDDPAGDHDWGFDVEVDLEASDEEGVAVLRLTRCRAQRLDTPDLDDRKVLATAGSESGDHRLRFEIILGDLRKLRWYAKVRTS